MALILYKHPSENRYILSLFNNGSTNNHVESAEFSPTSADLELHRILWTDATTHKIYILGKNLKEIFVFDLSSTTTGISPATVTTDHLNLRSSDNGHFSIDTSDDARRSVEKASILGNFIYTFGKNASGQNAVIVIKTSNGIDSARREATFLETGYFDDGTSYANSKYDIKTFLFGNAANDKGIVLKKGNELKLYRHDAQRCQ